MADETLRSLVNRITFEIDDRLLRESDMLLGSFQARAVESGGALDQVGVSARAMAQEIISGAGEAGAAVQEMGAQASGALDGARGSAGEAGKAVDEIKQKAGEAGREGKKAFGDLGGAIEGVTGKAGELKEMLAGGFAGFLGGGMVALFASAAMNAQRGATLLKFFVQEGTEEWGALQSAIAETIAISKGLHTQGALEDAVHRAAVLGTDIGLITREMKNAALIAAASGKGIGDVLASIGQGVEQGTIKPLMDLGIITEKTFAAMGEGMTKNIMAWDRQRREMFITGAIQEYVNDKMEVYQEYTDNAKTRLQAFVGVLGDLAETIGGPLLDPLTQVLSGLNEMMRTVNNNQVGRFALQAGGLAVTAGTLAAGLGAVGKAATYARAEFLPMLLPMAKAALIGAGMALVLEDLWTAWQGGDSLIEPVFDSFMEFLGIDYDFKQFRDNTIQRFKDIRDGATDAIDWIKQQWGDGSGWLADKFHGGLDVAKGSVKGWFGLLQVETAVIKGLLFGDWSLLRDGLDNVLGGMITSLRGWLPEYRGPIDRAGGIITGWVDKGEIALNRMSQAFMNLRRRIREALNPFGTELKEEAAGWIAGIIKAGPTGGLLGEMLEAGQRLFGQVQENIQNTRGFALPDPSRLGGDLTEIQSLYTPTTAPARGPHGSLGGSSSFTFELGDINIKTAATDAAGIARDVGASLEAELEKAIDRTFGVLRLKRPKTTER